MDKTNILTTIKKELRTIIRDKKYLFIILLFPFIIPVYIIFIGYFYDSIFYSEYNVGINYALNNNEKVIINEINEQYNLKISEYKSKDDLENDYQNKKIDAYIVKENDKYTIYADMSDSTGAQVASIAQAYLKSYNNYLANNFLLGEDIEPERVFNIVNVEINDLAKDGKNMVTNLILQMVIVFLLNIIIQTSQSISTDMIAGEKERGTLETTLTFPIKISELITGKFIAILLCCLTTSFLGIILTIPSLFIIKLLSPTFADMQMGMGIINFLLAFLILIIDSILASGLCILLTGRSKSFKEAQSALSILVIPTFATMFTTMLGIDTNIFLSVVPLLNCGVLLNDVFFSTINIPNLIAMLISSLIYILIIIKFISKQYKSEGTLF